MTMRQRHFSKSKRSTGTVTQFDWRELRRFVIVREHWDSTESPSDAGSEDAEEVAAFQKGDVMKKASIQYDYWTILKAMKFLKYGDQKACITALACMQSFDLQSPYNMFAITSQGGLDTLVNITETNDIHCRLGALQILEELSKDKGIATRIVHLGICPMLIKRLCECLPDIVEVAASIVANVGFMRKASTSLRMHGAIELLVSHLTVTKEMLLLEEYNLTSEEKTNLRVSTSAAHALWALAHYTKNKLKMLKTGLVQIMSNMILSGKKQVAIPMTGVLCECSTELLFQVAVETEGLVGVLVKDMLSDDAELQRLCSLALSRAAGGNAVVREMIRFHNGPKIIMQVITETDKSNKRLLTAGISALWKSAVSEENVKEFEKLDAVPMLIEFLNETHVEVLVATVGAIAEMAKSETAREMIISKGAMTEIISLLGHINEDLLANSAHAVGVCSDCDEGIEMLDKSDGLRLLWSLMKNQSQRVKVQALWAVKPCVARHPDSGELIRSLMGSLSLLVQMLGHDDCEVLTAVCAVISEVALDLENLAVMTEQGVVKRLSNLITRERRDTIQELAEERAAKGYQGVRFVKQEKRTELHRELASAVANCASLPDNRRAFGRAGVIPVIVGYLATTNSELLAQACRAMHTLSQDHFNCVSMQSCGAVANLLVAIESECMVTQIGAAGALKNIRNMLLKADYKKMAFLCLPRIEREKKQAEIEAIVKVLSGHREPEEEKKAVLKGLARSSLKSMVSFKSKESKEGKEGKKGKEASVNWAESQKKDSGVIRKQSSLLSWRERMSLITETTEEAHKERRPSELEAILAGKAAMRKGSHAAMGSQASQGSRSSAQPATEYATLDDVPPAGDADGDVNSDGVPEPMGAAGV